MRTSTVLLLVATAGFAGTSIYYARRAATLEHQLATQIQAGKPAFISGSFNQSTPFVSVETRRAQLAAANADGGKSPVLSAGTLAPGADAEEAQAVQAEVASMHQEMRKRMAEQMQSPARQRVLQTQVRAGNRRMYGEFAQEQGLTTEEANALYDLLTEHQLSAMSADLADSDSQPQNGMEHERRKQEALRTLLGDSRAQAFQEFQESMGARFEVDQIRDQLEAAQAPLTDEQRRRLIKATVETQAQAGFPRFDPGMSPEESRRVHLEWMERRAQALNAQARGILNAEQMQYLDDYQQMQRDMQSGASFHVGDDVVFASGSSTFFQAAPATIELKTEKKP